MKKWRVFIGKDIASLPINFKGWSLHWTRYLEPRPGIVTPYTVAYGIFSYSKEKEVTKSRQIFATVTGSPTAFGRSQIVTPVAALSMEWPPLALEECGSRRPDTVEKERPVSIDRFPWHRGIQKVWHHGKGHEKHNYSVCIVILQCQWLAVVLFVPFTFDSQGHVACKSTLVLVSKVLITWPIWKVNQLLKFLQSDCMVLLLNIPATSTKTCPKWPDVLSPTARTVNVWPTRLECGMSMINAVWSASS